MYITALFLFPGEGNTPHLSIPELVVIPSQQKNEQHINEFKGHIITVSVCEVV